MERLTRRRVRHTQQQFFLIDCNTKITPPQPQINKKKKEEENQV